MPVWVRRSAIALALLALVLAAGGAWLAASFDTERYKAMAVDWMRTHHDRQLAIEGPLRLTVFPRLALRVSGVRLSEVGTTAEFAAIDEAALSVRLLPLLRGRLEIDSASAHGVRARYRRDADGRSNIDDFARSGQPPPAAPPAGAAAPPRVDIGALALEDVRLRIDDARSGLAGELRLQSLHTGRLADGVETPVRWRLAAALTQPPLSGHADGSVQVTPDLAHGTVRLRELAIALDGRGPGGLTAKASHLTADRGVAGPEWRLEGLRWQLDGERAGRSVALDLRGEAGGRGAQARWTLAGTLDGAPLDVAGSVRPGASVPFVELHARTAALDLDRWLGAAAAPAAAASPAGEAAGERSIDLQPLTRLDGRFELQAGQLTWQRVRLDDLRLAATLAEGVLRVGTLQARAWDGRLDGTASAAARTRRFTLKGSADGIDMQALLQALAGRDTLEGRGRLAVDLSSSGASVGALKSNLAGTATLRLREGAVKGFDLVRALRQARAALTQRHDPVQAARGTEKTGFSSLDASFRLRDGVARSDDLRLDSPLLRITGAGSADIGRGRLDCTLDVRVEDPRGTDLAALQGLTVPVRLAGPFDAIDWQILWSKAAAGALQQRLEDRLRERLGLPAPASKASAPPQGSPVERLRKGLEGLLRR